MTDKFQLSRLVRTVSSEIYVVWEGEKRVGQLHLHFAHYTIHVVLMLEVDIAISDEEELIAQIDEDIVSSYLPSFEREEMLVTVFRGEEVSSFSYAPSGIEELDEEGE
ncbi:MAG: hypothetical protein NTU88_14185 [Armatimonadetes bacterium]|nr:hypothetical protein [Armatimonadota bacterium]